MTPKEKALKLVDKFKPFVYCYSGSGMLSNDYDKNIVLRMAKQCALIAADESINIFIEVYKKLVAFELIKGEVEDSATHIYWTEVKQEIEKL